MNRALSCLSLLILVASPSFADPASRARLQELLQDPRTNATSGRLLHAIGSEDLTLERGEIIGALSQAGAPAHARLILGPAVSIQSRQGSVSIDRLLTSDVTGGSRVVRVGTAFSYRVSGADLVDVRGLESGTHVATLRPIRSVIGAAAPAAPAPAPAPAPVSVQPSAPAATPPSAGIAGALTEALRSGSRGDKVKELQSQLNRHRDTGASVIDEDGKFGDKTETALRAFQAREGLPVTGQADAATLAALEAPPAMKRGERGEDVRALQRLLNHARRAAGLPAISTDGNFGGDTESALRAFQRSQGLPETGVVTGATEAALQAARPSTPAPSSGGYPSPLLERGHTGDPVRALQFLINKHRDAAGKPVIDRDSTFGSGTERALKEFQREQGLPETGIADPATWAALRAAPSAPVSTTPSVLRRGDSGNDVKTLQARLNRHREASHKAPIGVDGDFGAGTERAVREFQGSKPNLQSTGVVDAPTLAALNAEPPAVVPSGNEPPAPVSDGTLRGMRIGIDSGHGITGSGAFDPGAVNRQTGITEYDLNRRVATRVRDLLRARGATVDLQVYARGATRRSLYRKGSTAASGKHLFLSIHHNAYNASAQGSLVLVHQSLATSSSFSLGRAIQRNLVRSLWGGASNRDRGVRRQGLSVLRGAHSQVRTAVLVEGFFLDPRNVTRSVADAWVEREAQGIAAGVAEYWASR